MGNTFIKLYLVNPKRVSNAMARDPSAEASAAFKPIEPNEQG